MTTSFNPWREFGFSGDLYSTDSIELNERGRKMLVGRDHYLRQIEKQMGAGATVVALEGDFGVGKTSLARASAFDLMRWRGSGGPLFIATRDRLTLESSDSVASFEQKTMRVVASALIENEATLARSGRKLPDVGALKRWLNQPVVHSSGGGVSIGVHGVQVGGEASLSAAINDSDGFAEFGLVSWVDQWLRDAFPTPESGGVICFLDNLEDLGEARNALAVIEPLRDKLFKRAGLKWFISGANGLVRSVFTSPKIVGVFLDPIEVLPLSDDEAPRVISAREEVLREDEEAVAPVSEVAFAELYELTGQALRFALSLAQKYSIAQEPAEIRALTDEQRDLRFESYILAEAEKVERAYSSTIGRASRRVLRTLLDKKAGVSTPAEHRDFGYESMPGLLAQLESLIQANLITYSKDDDDQRRRIISATSQGRLLGYLYRDQAASSSDRYEEA